MIAYISTIWNVADLNTKPCPEHIFRRLTTLMLKGLHDFNWQRQVLRTLREIWQQTKQRDDRKELKERSDKYSESRKKAREQANQDRETTPTKQDEETLIKKLQSQQREIEEHKKIRQKLVEEGMR